jgi:hypothetical protein
MSQTKTIYKNYMDDVEFPSHLHNRIMSQFLFLRYRKSFFLMLALTSANLFFTWWHLWGTIVETRASELVAGLAKNFQWNLGYFEMVLVKIHQVVPFSILLSFAASLGLIFYTVRLFTSSNSALLFLRKQKNPSLTAHN